MADRWSYPGFRVGPDPALDPSLLPPESGGFDVRQLYGFGSMGPSGSFGELLASGPTDGQSFDPRYFNRRYNSPPLPVPQPSKPPRLRQQVPSYQPMQSGLGPVPYDPRFDPRALDPSLGDQSMLTPQFVEQQRRRALFGAPWKPEFPWDPAFEAHVNPDSERTKGQLPSKQRQVVSPPPNRQLSPTRTLEGEPKPPAQRSPVQPYAKGQSPDGFFGKGANMEFGLGGVIDLGPVEVSPGIYWKLLRDRQGNLQLSKPTMGGKVKLPRGFSIEGERNFDDGNWRIGGRWTGHF